jgi:hypothetical protein
MTTGSGHLSPAQPGFQDQLVENYLWLLNPLMELAFDEDRTAWRETGGASQLAFEASFYLLLHSTEDEPPY